MKGKELREIVKHSGIPIKELAKKSGIPEPTIYSLYKKEQVEYHYIKNLIKGGLEVTIKNYEVSQTNDNTFANSAKPMAATMGENKFDQMIEITKAILLSHSITQGQISKSQEQHGMLLDMAKIELEIIAKSASEDQKDELKKVLESADKKNRLQKKDRDDVLGKTG